MIAMLRNQREAVEASAPKHPQLRRNMAFRAFTSDLLGQVDGSTQYSRATYFPKRVLRYTKVLKYHRTPVSTVGHTDTGLPCFAPPEPSPESGCGFGPADVGSGWETGVGRDQTHTHTPTCTLQQVTICDF